MLRISPEDWTYDRVRSGYWRLYVNERKGAQVISNGVSFPINPDTAFVVPAWVEFDSRCSGEVRQMFLHFDVIGMGGQLVRQWFQRPIPLPAEGTTLSLIQWLRVLLEENGHDRLETAFLAKSLIDLSLARLLTIVPDNGEDAAQKSLMLEQFGQVAPVLPALRRIEENFAIPALNSELADCCGMSEDHFIRVFRRLLGQTPARYALERRIAMAAERLAFGSDSVEQIAEDSGFTNRFHFTRVFTRIIGVSPANYRKSRHI